MRQNSVKKVTKQQPASCRSIKSGRSILGSQLPRPASSFQHTFDHNISSKQNQQYQAVAIKLGLMPKKVKIPTTKQSMSQTNLNKIKTQINSFQKTGKLSKQLTSYASTFKQNSIKYGNLQSRINPKQEQQYSQITKNNPYSQLQNKLYNNNIPIDLENQQQIQKIYSKYLASQKNDSTILQSCKSQQIPNDSIIKTEKAIGQLKVSLNQLINKFSRQHN